MEREDDDGIGTTGGNAIAKILLDVFDMEDDEALMDGDEDEVSVVVALNASVGVIPSRICALC